MGDVDGGGDGDRDGDVLEKGKRCMAISPSLSPRNSTSHHHFANLLICFAGIEVFDGIAGAGDGGAIVGDGCDRSVRFSN
jgi:hypothetical protein